MLPLWQYVGKETRSCCFEWMSMEERLHTLNKQLFRGNSFSCNESTAYRLIFNMFYTKQYFWIELFLEFTMKKCCFIWEVTDFLRQVGFSLRHFSFIPEIVLPLGDERVCITYYWRKRNGQLGSRVPYLPITVQPWIEALNFIEIVWH